MSERLITVLQFSSFKTASAISAGLLVSIAGFASAPESVLAESTCPQPAVALASDEVVPVTKANYSKAETQPNTEPQGDPGALETFIREQIKF